MTQDDRFALRLAARLIEAGTAPEVPDESADAGPVWQGLFLAHRLQQAIGPERSRDVAARLKEAAGAA